MACSEVKFFEISKAPEPWFRAKKIAFSSLAKKNRCNQAKLCYNYPLSFKLNAGLPLEG